MDLQWSDPAEFSLHSYARGELHQRPLRWFNQSIIGAIQEGSSDIFILP